MDGQLLVGQRLPKTLLGSALVDHHQKGCLGYWIRGRRPGRRAGGKARAVFLGQPVIEVEQAHGPGPLVEHHLAAVVMERRLHHAHHGQGFRTLGLAGHRGGHLPHRQAPQLVSQLPSRQQHQGNKGGDGPLQGQ